MKHRAPMSGAAVFALALAACSYAPSMRHPTLPSLTPAETAMDCTEIDVAIDRADTVRWLIRDDGGRLETRSQRGARYAGNVVLVPLFLLHGNIAFLPDGGHAVVNAADGRIRQLLQLKRAHGCQPRATTLPGMDDFALLNELDSVQSKIDAAGGDEHVLMEERTRLLDGLRVVPVPPPPQRDTR